MNVLYILMRTDLPSMNPGKAMAQASHASNAFINNYTNEVSSHCGPNIGIWQKDTQQGFGTVLVLAVTGPELKAAMKTATDLGIPSDVVIDPSYPYRVNGEIAKLLDPQNEYEGNKEYTLYRSEFTCGYVFGDKDCSLVKNVVGSFKLHQ
jgi:peptidyl-tRNA hydrolase